MKDCHSTSNRFLVDISELTDPDSYGGYASDDSTKTIVECTSTTRNTKKPYQLLFTCHIHYAEFFNNGFIVKHGTEKLMMNIELVSSQNEMPNYRVLRRNKRMLSCRKDFSPCVFDLNIRFSFPRGSFYDQILRRVLAQRQPAAVPSMYDRCVIAHNIASSIHKMHLAGFMHTNISPDTIFLAGKNETEHSYKSLRSLFPVSAKSSTKARGFYKGIYSDSFQTRLLYLNPRHYRDLPSKASNGYRMYDDLWALGVCLIEIGLWRSLLVPKHGEIEYFLEESISTGLSSTSLGITLLDIVNKELRCTMTESYCTAVKRCIKYAGYTKTEEALPQLLEFESSMLTLLRPASS